MPIQSTTQSDDELIAILDVGAIWVLRAGGAVLAAPGKLRDALSSARRQRASTSTRVQRGWMKQTRGKRNCWSSASPSLDVFGPRMAPTKTMVQMHFPISLAFLTPWPLSRTQSRTDDSAFATHH